MKIKNRFTIIDNALYVTLPLTQGEKLIVSVEQKPIIVHKKEVAGSKRVWCREDEEMRRHNIRCNGIATNYATDMLPGTYQMTSEIADKIVDGSFATVHAMGIVGVVMTQAYVISFDCLEDTIAVNSPAKSFEELQAELQEKNPLIQEAAKCYITSRTNEERLQRGIENLSQMLGHKEFNSDKTEISGANHGNRFTLFTNLSRMLEHREFNSGKTETSGANHGNRFTLFTNEVVGEIGDRLRVVKVNGCIVGLATPDGTEDNGCIVICGNLPDTTSMNSKIAYQITVGSYATVIGEGKLECLGNKPRALIVSFDCLE